MILADACTNAGFLIRIVVNLFKYLRFILPIILVIFIIFDLSKVIVSNVDEKAKKDAFSKIVKRALFAIIIFFIPTIITIVFKQIENISRDEHTSTTSTSWIDCWLSEYNK